MGYRELLKRYLCFVEMYAGDTYIDALEGAADMGLGARGVAELRTLVGEINRELCSADDLSPGPDFNHRLRLLCACYRLTPARAAALANVNVEKLRRWRASPRSEAYRVMRADEFARFERALHEWLRGAGESALERRRG